MILIPTSSAQFLAKKLAKEFRVVLPQTKDGQRIFPDGEIYARLNLPKTERVVVLHAGMPSPNEGLVELEMILGILSAAKIKKIEVFFTYFPYSMQDRGMSGEINMAELIVKKLIKFYRVSKIYVLNPHFANKAWIKKYPVQIVSALPLLMQAATKKYPKIIFVAVDQGSQERTGLMGFKKTRISISKAKFTFNSQIAKLIKNQTVGLVDDLIETGSTLIGGHRLCKQAGAKQVIALATHGVVPKGVKKIQNVFQEVFLTNSIQTAEGRIIDVSRLISKTSET